METQLALRSQLEEKEIWVSLSPFLFFDLSQPFDVHQVLAQQKNSSVMENLSPLVKETLANFKTNALLQIQ